MPFRPTFLLIEDNLIDQLIIKQLFKKVLFINEIHVANNGKEGLDWLRENRAKHNALFILLDIQMPIMNGFDFLNVYSQFDNAFKKDVKIYILSSTLDPDEIKQIKENKDVFKLLSKPFPIEEFKNALYHNL
ncbi:response regulator [Flavobacterium sp. JLP]|uniref:response regulator n=1 Tax=unclassified Flavobacterium TaxID=196869 RepID=UPI001889EEE1|nr:MULTISPECIES: response regulator [unclassified Flavobacterium]MBF4494326.1 response regulator [Flavobacterium sp. MR2016-29]MBF4508793.1 response regulator [Flavobacterium sp. JLP]